MKPLRFRWLARVAPWLGMLACGCATSPRVLRPADEAFERGDMREAAQRYQQTLDARWLAPPEFAHATERMKQAAVASLPSRLRALEPLLEEAPVLELLELLGRLRVELAAQGLGVAEQRPVLEAMQRVIERRAWPEVEALERAGRYLKALERAQALAVYLPPEAPLWQRVARLRQQALAHRERPTREPPLLDQKASRGTALAITALAIGQEGLARRLLVNAADASRLSSSEFFLRLGLLLRLESPELVPPVPVPDAPPMPESVKQAGAPRTFVYGRTGPTAAPWRSLPEEDRLPARGAIAYDMAGQLGSLWVPDVPGQPGKVAGLVGVRATLAPLAALRQRGAGWGVQDQALAELFLGTRLSAAHSYLPSSPGDPNPQESQLAFGGVLAYSVLYGWRGHPVGLFVGMRAQYTGYQAGDVTAAGLMVPLVAWVELRWDERRPVLLQGWLTPFEGSASQGLLVQVPVRQGTWLTARYEALSLDSRMGGLYREDRVDIGQRGATMLTMGAGMAW